MSITEIPTAPRLPGEGVRLFGFTVGYVNMPLTFFLAGEPGEVRAPVTAYLIDHPKGLVLFDTGLGPRFERPKGAPLESFVDIETGDTMDARLRAIGVDPADIRWIIVSHLHTDHTGGNLYFPNATIVVHQAEYRYALDQGPQEDPRYFLSEYDTGQPIKAIAGEYDLFDDGTIVVFPTLGHSPGHQSVRVRTDGGSAVLCGDCCSMKRTLDEFKMPDQCFDADKFLESLKTLAEMQKNGTRVFPSHDPDFWDTIPKGVPIR